jgi:hypothetical protein
MRHVTIFLTAIVFAAAMQSGLGAGSDNRLPFPSGYREWVWLSSGFGMTYSEGAGAPQFDNVFVDRASWSVFEQTGHWPDKTVLVVEERASATHGSINKEGHFQTAMVGLAAHVRDGRLPGGWAFYDFGLSKEPARMIPTTAACYSCHQKSGAVDTTFVQFYPTALEIAKRKGTVRE